MKGTRRLEIGDWRRTMGFLIHRRTMAFGLVQTLGQAKGHSVGGDVVWISPSSLPGWVHPALVALETREYKMSQDEAGPDVECMH
jgi:hypothetical protein